MRLLYPKLKGNAAKKLYEVFVLVLSIIFSSAIILWDFPNTPKNLDFDEVEFARLALDLEGKPYTPYHPYATGHTTLYYYIILLSFKIFGITNFALRFPSALFGIIAAASLVFLVKEFDINKKLKTKLILFLPLFLASTRWFFNFARFGYEATFLLSLEILSLSFLFSYINKDSKKALIASGIFTALAYNSYAAGRIFFLLPGIILTMQVLKTRKYQDLLVWSSSFLILTLPLNMYFITQGTDKRAVQQIFFLDPNLNMQEKISFLYQNIKKYILMFFYKGDINGRHNYPGKPALSPIQIPLLLSGTALLIKKAKELKQPILTFLLWSIISLIPPVLTYPWENPNMLRSFTILPSLSFIFSLGVFAIHDITKKFKANIWTLFTLILLANTFYELRTYYVFQKPIFSQAFIEVTPLEKLYKLGKLKIND